jgi:hypothetical protein
MSLTITKEVTFNDICFRLVTYCDGSRTFSINGETIDNEENAAKELTEVLSWLRPATPPGPYNRFVKK